MKNTKILLTFACVIFVFFLLPFKSLAEPQRFTIPLNDSVQKGPADAPVTIIEFLDFQ